MVKHPKEWIFCGCNEIQNPRKRYGLINYQRLLALLQMRGLEDLQEDSQQWIEDALVSRNYSRDTKWTEGIAVGSKRFVVATKERLGIKAKGRKVLGQDGTHELREPPAPYKGHFGTEKGLLRPENTYYWNASP